MILILLRLLTVVLSVWANLVIAQELASSTKQIQQSPTSFISLISPRDIAQVAQFATQFAAQTFRNNGDLLSNSGPEVRPVSLDARPSEIFGQSLTNMMSPTRQQVAKTLRQVAETPASSNGGRMPLETPSNTGTSLIERLAGSFPGGATEAKSTYDSNSNLESENRGNMMGMDGMVGQAMRLFSGAQTSNNPEEGIKTNRQANAIPTLDQILPGAGKNFGFRQGEGCVPFIGEFMKMAYGNCVKRADEKTWDTWGKEFSTVLMGGKIDFLRASKETCKMGAEREHCGQLRKAISECNILGSIQMATNLQRSVARCDEVTGIIDQNPSTVLNQMNGLINGEMAQGFLNNFLG